MNYFDQGRGLEEQSVLLGAFDVICGVGSNQLNHRGNKYYRGLIRHHFRLYQSLQSKREKGRITESIIKTIHGKGGRFLKETEDGSYENVSQEDVREKVSHALRSTKDKKPRRPVQEKPRPAEYCPIAEIKKLGPVPSNFLQIYRRQQQKFREAQAKIHAAGKKEKRSKRKKDTELALSPLKHPVSSSYVNPDEQPLLRSFNGNLRTTRNAARIMNEFQDWASPGSSLS